MREWGPWEGKWMKFDKYNLIYMHMFMHMYLYIIENIIIFVISPFVKASYCCKFAFIHFPNIANLYAILFNTWILLEKDNSCLNPIHKNAIMELLLYIPWLENDLRLLIIPNHGGIVREEMLHVCGASLKPLHLHNPSTSVGNMEVVNCLENV